VLGRFIAFQRVALAFRKKLLASLVYPALLVTMVMVMFTFLLSYVVPQFQSLYSQLGNGTASLPGITLFVLGIGEVVKHWLWAIVLGLAGAVFFLWRWSKTEGGSITIDRVRLALPLAGGIWLKYQVAIFSRTLSTLLSGGLPLVQALETAGSSIESKLLSNAVLQSVQKVREGLPLSRSKGEKERTKKLKV